MHQFNRKYVSSHGIWLGSEAVKVVGCSEGFILFIIRKEVVPNVPLQTNVRIEKKLHIQWCDHWNW